MIAETYRDNGKKCCVTLSKQPHDIYNPICFPLAKNGPFTQVISEQLNT